MRKFFLLAAVIVLFCTFAKGDSLFVSPSSFFTAGDYSNKASSMAFSFYNTLGLNENNFLINEYEILNIDDPFFRYKQQTFLIGTYSAYFPWYMKFNYAHLMGDYNEKKSTSMYTDITNIFNTDISFYYEGFYFGSSVTYLHEDGFKKQRTGQITLRIEKIITPEIFLSVKPNYSTLLDGRKLFSVALKAHYLVTPSLLLKAGGFVGERAYYFDSDILTIFNQDYTQKNQLFAQAEYNFIPSLKMTLAYQHTAFSEFKINYFVAGLKYWFFL